MLKFLKRRAAAEPAPAPEFTFVLPGGRAAVTVEAGTVAEALGLVRDEFGARAGLEAWLVPA